MINRKLLKNLDYVFISVVIFIMSLSLLVFHSAAANIHTDSLFYVKKQLTFIGLGTLAIIFILRLDYSKLIQYNKYLYIFNILLLLSVFLVGNPNRDTCRWIELGPFLFQPSEIAKILVIITFGIYLLNKKGQLNRFRDLIPCFLYVGLPMLLIMKQPDLGTSLVLLAIMFGMLYIAGARPALLTGLITGGLVLVVAAIWAHLNLGLSLPLKGYQVQRLIIFFDPYSDPHGDGYHMIQSMVAIGSGGLLGKGFFHGSQVQLNFLPEHHTDFIFSVLGEEAGFIGGTFLLVLYFVMMYRAIRIASEARDLLGTYLVIGIVSMWTFHILENIGMAVGIMPITGLPLPFLSYGGSAMLTNLIAVGIVLNVNLRRERMLF